MLQPAQCAEPRVPIYAESYCTSPPLQPRPSESRQVPRLSDLTHLPPCGAQLASPEGPRPTAVAVGMPPEPTSFDYGTDDDDCPCSGCPHECDCRCECGCLSSRGCCWRCGCCPCCRCCLIVVVTVAVRNVSLAVVAFVVIVSVTY